MRKGLPKAGTPWWRVNPKPPVHSNDDRHWEAEFAEHLADNAKHLIEREKSVERQTKRAYALHVQKARWSLEKRRTLAQAHLEAHTKWLRREKQSVQALKRQVNSIVKELTHKETVEAAQNVIHCTMRNGVFKALDRLIQKAEVLVE